MVSRVVRSRYQRVVRLAVVFVLAAAIQGGCSVDDRVLTGPDVGSSGSGGGGPGRCGAASDSVCEQCLYEACCDETRACGQDSACATYLDCASSCAGNSICREDCAANSPTGFGDALALGVCSQSQCPVCSGERDTFEGCDPDGFGACQSASDCSALESGALESLDVSTCPACEDLAAPGCAACLSDQTGLSEACSGCVADWLSCAVVSCSLECQVAADSAACGECLRVAGCNTQLDTCGFSG